MGTGNSEDRPEVNEVRREWSPSSGGFFSRMMGMLL